MSASQYTLHALDRGLAVLEELAAATDDRSLTELSQRLCVSQTVVFRILKTLETPGYVQQDPVTKRYRLGLRAWEIGARAVARTGLTDVARPVLRWLTDVTGETSGLAVVRDTDVLYMDMVEGSEPLRVYAEVGSRAPIYATATGKAMLAYREPALLERVLAAGMKRLTATTITRASELRRRLAAVRSSSLSVNHGERRADISAVAAPIFGRSGECVAAVTVSGPTTRFHGDNLDTLKRHVQKAAREISGALGSPGHVSERSRHDVLIPLLPIDHRHDLGRDARGRRAPAKG
jgi:DNA-binding IclR family transcriptional regulator